MSSCTTPTSVDINREQGRANFFQECVERMLTYWRDHEAIKTIDVAVLDRERHRILKDIMLGLDLQPLWPLVKKLVIAFAPYMERRGFWDVWHGLLTHAIRMAQRAKDVEAETTLTAFLARLCQRMSKPQEVVYHYRRVIRLARQSGNRFEEARAFSNLGYLYIDVGHWWRSEVLSKHALIIFGELASEHGQAHTHNHLGVLFTRQEVWVKAEQHFLAACKIWDLMSDQHGLMRGHGNLGRLYNEMDQPLKAIEHSTVALNFASLVGEESICGTFLMNVAIGHMKQGNMEKAYQYANDAEGVLLKFSDKLQLAYVWHQLCLFNIQTGQLSEAEFYKTQALAVYHQFHLQSDKSRLLNDISWLKSKLV